MIFFCILLEYSSYHIRCFKIPDFPYKTVNRERSSRLAVRSQSVTCWSNQVTLISIASVRFFILLNLGLVHAIDQKTHLAINFEKKIPSSDRLILSYVFLIYNSVKGKGPWESSRCFLMSFNKYLLSVISFLFICLSIYWFSDIVMFEKQ